uniref:Integral membrane protein n=1 Tax=Streptomyces sp. NBC_00008 TaxID=2903610 RepID=A0AAU2VH80_9ACTN
MTGTDNAVADDALYVLTAVLLTPAQFPSVLGDDYPAACAALGLGPYATGYGLVMGQDGDGARWTVVVDDVSLVAVAIASWDCGMEYDLSPDERSVVCALPGWPLAVAVAAPGVAAPHDPPPGPGADGGELPPLAPPDPGVWGPAQRRLGADAIASQWADWREQINDGTALSAAGHGSPAETTGDVEASGADGEDAGAGTGDGESASVGTTEDEDVVPDSAHTAPVGGHPGVRRALAEARAYLDAPPPPGRIRSSFAPGDARTIRADGPGWSMAARTDDMAFLLLDEMPGEILPVRRGAELPGLLDALDALAVRPS